MSAPSAAPSAGVRFAIRRESGDQATEAQTLIFKRFFPKEARRPQGIALSLSNRSSAVVRNRGVTLGLDLRGHVLGPSCAARLIQAS